MSDLTQSLSLMESTTSGDRARGLRQFHLSGREEGREIVLGITVALRSNVGLYDESPRFEPVPGEVIGNATLGLMLSTIVPNLLDHGMFDHLPR